MKVSNFFFIKIRNNFTRFVKFLIISYTIWFVITPSFTLNGFKLNLLIAFITAVFLCYVIELSFYKHMLNFLAFFKRIGFYKYLAFMVKEITISAYYVVMYGFNFRKPYYSQIITITLPPHTPFDKSLLVLASIILTPGTTVIKTDGKTLTVHCLTEPAYQTIEEGNFVKTILSFNF